MSFEPNIAMIEDAIRAGSVERVTPGGLKFWVPLDHFRVVLARMKDAEAAAATGARLLAGPIIVSTHAVLRARRRNHWSGAELGEIHERILAEVTAALAAGRVSDHRPVWATPWSMFELGGQKPKPARCKPGSRFVWDVQEQHGWIVTDDGVVATSMHRVRAEAAA